MTDLLHALRTFATENIGLKLLALLLSILIHVVVQRDSVRETEVDLPITVQNLPKGQVFVGALPETVKVRVRGRRGGIRELLADRTAKVVLDLGAYRDGERYVFEQDVVEQQLPSRHVEVLGVQPASIDVRLEAMEERTVPVEPTVQGEPAAGFRVLPKGVRAEPARVRVSGPASQVRRILAVRTAAVDLAGTEADLRQTARLLPPAERHVRLSAEEVTVEVNLEEQSVSRALAAQPVAVRGCPNTSRCLLEPADVELRIEGLVRAVNALLAKPPEGLVFADVAGPIDRNERQVRLGVLAIKGVLVTAVPAVAKFSLLSEIPPVPAP